MSLCQACGAENAGAAKFCSECGSPLHRLCPSCGAPVGPSQRFCSECGSPLSASAVPFARQPGATAVSERRVCSVLFCDLVGFTPLSEARDPEQVRELLSQYFELARTVVERYGGVVEKFIGDAVMAVWGTPVTTEGDAERAVRAALDLLDAVSELGQRTAIERLAARAGVVTGEVAVTLGAIGQGMVAGDAVNTAARVQAAASANTVLVDSTTRRLAGAAVGFEDAGDHLLKGKAEPERLWRATRVLAMVGGGQRLDGLEAPLTGREAELRTIKELFHAAVDRRMPRMVVVAGAAGVGKSRLGWEFEKYLDGLASSVFWHRGRCLSYGDGVSFWALAEAVRQRLAIAEEDPTDVAAEKLASGLAEIVPDPTERQYVGVRIGRLLGLPFAGDLGAALGREELFAGWRTFFERLAASAPVAWVIEDAHSADSGLLDFLDHLTDWVRDLPLYLLVLARPELEERRPGFGVGRNRSLLTLDPLDTASMDALVEALVPGIPPDARAAITGHAQGMPLFAVETVRSLVDQDVVRPVEGVYRLVGDVGKLTVPDSLHGLLAARLDALEPHVRALVGDAAVLGSTFPAQALVAVSGQGEEAVRAGLAELVRREVLEVSADRLSPQRGSYRFAQQLLRQVAYDTLSRRDRKNRHLAVAAHLRATFADDGEEAADVIARHYLDALTAVPDDEDTGEIRLRAIEMSVRAADRARRAGAPAAAAANYATAAELAESAGLPEGAPWREKAAEAAIAADDVETALREAEHARRLYSAAGDDRAAARARVLTGRVLRHVGKHTAAREELTAALAALRSDPDRDTVMALSELVGLETFAGGPDAQRLSTEALELGQALEADDALLAQLFSLDGIMHSFADRPRQAAASFEYASRLGESSGDSAVRGRALLNLANVLLDRDAHAAAAAAREAVALVRRLGERRILAFAIANLGEALLSIGEWSELEILLGEATTTDGLEDQDIVQALRGVLCGLRGDGAGAARFLAGLPQFRASEDPQDRSTLDLLETLAAEANGEARRALECARRVVASASAVGLQSTPVRICWSQAVRNAEKLGEDDVVAEMLAEFDPQPPGHLGPFLRSERDLARARLLTRAGDHEAAGALYAEALAGLRSIPALLHVAHGLIDQAAHMKVIGDEAGSVRALAEAEAIAEKLGAEPLMRRIHESHRQLV